MPMPTFYSPDLGLAGGHGDPLAIPLRRCQGKPLETIEDHGRIVPSPRAKCPLHHCMCRMTDWICPQGLDSQLREFYCWIGRHAFYYARPQEK